MASVIRVHVNLWTIRASLASAVFTTTNNMSAFIEDLWYFFANIFCVNRLCDEQVFVVITLKK